MKIKLLQIIQPLFKLGFFIFLAMVFFNSGIFYERYSNQQDLITFFTTQNTYTVSRAGALPSSVLEQLNFYNSIIGWVWLALVCIWIYLTLDYFTDKENHFITKIIRGVQNRRQILGTSPEKEKKD